MVRALWMILQHFICIPSQYKSFRKNIGYKVIWRNFSARIAGTMMVIPSFPSVVFEALLHGNTTFLRAAIRKP
jgi:hypothetical protein